MNTDLKNINKDHLKIIVTDSGLGGLSVQALLNKELENSQFRNIEIIFLIMHLKV
jgi:hypothetical protein